MVCFHPNSFSIHCGGSEGVGGSDGGGCDGGSNGGGRGSGDGGGGGGGGGGCLFGVSGDSEGVGGDGEGGCDGGSKGGGRGSGGGDGVGGGRDRYGSCSIDRIEYNRLYPSINTLSHTITSIRSL